MRRQPPVSMLVVALFLSAALGAACDIKVGNGDFDVGIAHGKAQDEWTRSYDLKRGGKIQIVNVNGRINVEPTEGSTFVVRAERIVKARSDESARAVLEKLDILETTEGNTVKLQTKPRERLSMGQSQEVRYYLKVPQGVDVDLQTTNGAVEVKAIKGGVIASATNGAVRGHGLNGPVDASTTNGSIELELSSVDGEVKAQTVNGAVRLFIPEDAKADIVARCVNGSIGVDNLKLDSNVERSRRRLEAKLNGGGPRIEVDTTNGGIRISGKSMDR